ncbi:hypothetical protein GOODEAATRI_010296 [Goodea atripinnis]|uniref:Uncharacterized protein n=1 Tax=Goodea atripinnis TaxID=208336 RepID=A0ABV0MGZ0_9TELE
MWVSMPKCNFPGGGSLRGSVSCWSSPDAHSTDSSSSVPGFHIVSKAKPNLPSNCAYTKTGRSLQGLVFLNKPEEEIRDKSSGCALQWMDHSSSSTAAHVATRSEHPTPRSVTPSRTQTG